VEFVKLWRSGVLRSFARYFGSRSDASWLWECDVADGRTQEDGKCVRYLDVLADELLENVVLREGGLTGRGR
jgi:hypothetical protein